jgi:hypothetical protein
MCQRILVYHLSWQEYTEVLLKKIIITAGSRVLLEKLTDQQPVKKFHAFYGTAFKSTCNLSLS